MCITIFKVAAQATAIVGIAQQGRESLGSSVFWAATDAFSGGVPGVVFGDSDSDVANSVVDIVQDVPHVGVDHVQNADQLVAHVPNCGVVPETGPAFLPSIAGPVVGTVNAVEWNRFVSLCSLITSAKCSWIYSEKIFSSARHRYWRVKTEAS